MLRTPGRHVQSVADASFDAWIKFYRQDENSPNAVVSYYAKGALVALALDLTLRRDGRTTLDDLMRALWQRYGETGIGVPEDGIRTLASELAGRDCRDFFARYVDGTEDPPLRELLRSTASRSHLRAATGAKRSRRQARNGTATPRAWLGAKVGADSSFSTCSRGGPAERAGLAAGDTLVAFDGVQRVGRRARHAARRGCRKARSVAVHAFPPRRADAYRPSMLAAAPLDTAGSPSTTRRRTRRTRGAPRGSGPRSLQPDRRIERVAPGHRGLRQHVALHRARTSRR